MSKDYKTEAKKAALRILAGKTVDNIDSINGLNKLKQSTKKSIKKTSLKKEY